MLRTSGGNGYNKYLVNLGANSVTRIVISSVGGGKSDFAKDAIAKAEVVFIAGGDQSTYVNLWRGTALQTAVNAVSTVHVTNGGSFTLGSWTSTSSSPYTLSVSNAVVSSSTGSIY